MYKKNQSKKNIVTTIKVITKAKYKKNAKETNSIHNINTKYQQQKKQFFFMKGRKGIC